MDNLLTILSMITQSGSDLHDSLVWMCEAAEETLNPNHFFTNADVGKLLKSKSIHLFDLLHRVCSDAFTVVHEFGRVLITELTEDLKKDYDFNLSVEAAQKIKSLLQDETKTSELSDLQKEFFSFVMDQYELNSKLNSHEYGWVRWADSTISNVIDHKDTLETLTKRATEE